MLLAEAKRALFNRQSMTEILVNCLILGEGEGSKAALGTPHVSGTREEGEIDEDGCIRGGGRTPEGEVTFAGMVRVRGCGSACCESQSSSLLREAYFVVTCRACTSCLPFILQEIELEILLLLVSFAKGRQVGYANPQQGVQL